VAACAARGAPPPAVGFGRNTPTFDVFYWLQVTNYGVLYVLFDSPPGGSNHIDVWDLCPSGPLIINDNLALRNESRTPPMMDFHWRRSKLSGLR
jgi:hypothetical protein